MVIGFPAQAPAEADETQSIRGERLMSENKPECPLYNPLNCKEYYNPKLCAFVRDDKQCLKKKKPRQKPRAKKAG
jgi:hypothetical protein